MTYELDLRSFLDGGEKLFACVCLWALDPFDAHELPIRRYGYVWADDDAEAHRHAVECLWDLEPGRALLNSYVREVTDPRVLVEVRHTCEQRLASRSPSVPDVGAAHG